MLASLRPAAVSWLLVRKNGLPDRMSTWTRRRRPEAGATGAGIRPRPRRGVLIATYLVWQAAERVVGGLLLAADRLEAGLPACEAPLVAQEEPRHHRDARVPTGDRVRLRQVARLLRPAHTEVPVGRPRLVAVLRNPQLLVAVLTRELPDQDADVREGDDRLCPGHRGRALVRPAVVRVVGVDVEVAAAQPVALQCRQERQRRDRLPAAPRTVVPARIGAAAGHGLLQVRRMDARPDGCAHLRVGARGDRNNLMWPEDRPLRPQEDRVVRLVPGHPAAEGRKHRPVRGLVRAAVALSRREGELAQVDHAARGSVRLLALVGPA